MHRTSSPTARTAWQEMQAAHLLRRQPEPTYGMETYVDELTRNADRIVVDALVQHVRTNVYKRWVPKFLIRPKRVKQYYCFRETAARVEWHTHNMVVELVITSDRNTSLHAWQYNAKTKQALALEEPLREILAPLGVLKM